MLRARTRSATKARRGRRRPTCRPTVFNVETRVRVTPAPAQFELPVWVPGRRPSAIAVDRGLGVRRRHRRDASPTSPAWWASARRRPSRRWPGGSGGRRRWAARPAPPATLDADRAVDRAAGLAAGRRPRPRRRRGRSLDPARAPRRDGRADARRPPPRPARPLPARARASTGPSEPIADAVPINHPPDRRNRPWLRPTSSTPSAPRWASAAAGSRKVHPVDLSAHVLRALVERTGDRPRPTVDDVIWGCVGQIGAQAWNIARNAWLSAGFPEEVPGVTIDRQCGSSQQAVHFAAQGVMAGVVRPGRSPAASR